MKNFTYLVASLITSFSFGQTDHVVNAQAMSWSPDDITINVGDSITWFNNGAGNHNLNGTTATFASNPESFTSGAASGNWIFGKRFNVPGVYLYRCDVHSAMMIGKVTVVDPSTSLSENSAITMKFGPNPAKDVINFTTDSKDFSIQIYDMLGNKVVSQRMKDQNQLDISSLTPGMYMVEIKTGDQYIKKKLIKK